MRRGCREVVALALVSRVCEDAGMAESSGYAVFFFPPALEALGDGIRPYLQMGPAGPFVPCREVDTGGAFVEMTLEGRAPDGRTVELELMVPGNMVRMIVSARADAEFGFYDRAKPQVPAAKPEPEPQSTPAADSPPPALPSA